MEVHGQIPAALAIALFAVSSVSACAAEDGSNTTDDSREESTALPGTATALTTSSSEDTSCRTFGFRNWDLQRDDGETTLSGEAQMPTPAWSINLQRHDDDDGGSIRLIMETIEPPGPSSSVISWVGFETSFAPETSTETVVSVLCEDEVVWTSDAATGD